MLLSQQSVRMLKVTLHDSLEAITFQVEGRLVGAWAAELEQSWKTAALVRGNKTRIVDLTGILFIDGEGQRVLKTLFREGASFRTAGPMTESIVSEITEKSRGAMTAESSGAGCESKTAWADTEMITVARADDN
jgi:hypothetical protein